MTHPLAFALSDLRGRPSAEPRGSADDHRRTGPSRTRPGIGTSAAGVTAGGQISVDGEATASTRVRRPAVFALALVAAAFTPGGAAAGLVAVLPGSSVRYTHTSGLPNATDPDPVLGTVDPVTFFGSRVTAGNGESEALGALAGYVGSSGLPSLAALPGTGVTQFAPDGILGPARLRIDFDVQFLIDDLGFGPPVPLSYAIGVAAVIPDGDGNSARFEASFGAFSLAQGDLLPPVQIGAVFDTPGNNTLVFQDTLDLSPNVLGPGDVLSLRGFLLFETTNNGLPTAVRLLYFDVNAIPEPASLALAGLGAAGLLVGRARRPVRSDPPGPPV